MPNTVKWKSPTDGDWAAAASWDSGTAPNAVGIDAVLAAAAAPYTVTIIGGESFTTGTVTIGFDAILSVSGALTLGSGTSTVLAGGKIDGGNNATIGGNATLLNNGTIAGDIAGQALLLFDGFGRLTVTNVGLMQASNGGQLDVETPKFTNFASHVLTGGSYAASGNGSQLGFWGSTAATAAFTTAAADVTLDGAGSEIVSGASGGGFSLIETTLTTIAAGGALHLLGARGYAGLPLTVAGLLDLHGGVYAGALAIAAGGSVTGFGAVSGAIADGGTIEASGGILTLSDNFTGGAVTVDAGATLALHGSLTNPVDNGLLWASGGTLLVNGPTGGSGGFLIERSATLELASATGPVSFNGPAAMLRLDAPASFSGTLFGFGDGDKIYLAGIHADAATGANGGITLTRAGATVQRLNVAGNETGAHFTVAYDGAGTLLTATGAAPPPRDFAYENDVLWTSRTLTWSFATATYSSDRDNPFTHAINSGSAEATVIQQALQKWQSVSGLSFVQVADSPTLSGAADIRIGWNTFGPTPGGAGEIGQAIFSFLLGGNAILPDALVRLEDPSQVALVAGTGGALTYQGFTSTLYQVALHELGHALGLGHSLSDTGAVMFPTAGTANRDVAASDIAGVQALYGSAQPCFLAGTRIATPTGEVAVETLAPGDLVLTRSGEALPVVWVGQRRVDAAGHPLPNAVLPICIRRDAFGPGQPAHDLWVSPDHALFTAGVLVPARLLINGASIFRDMEKTRPHYFHIELPRHAILLAENLPAESYLDTGNRANFADASGALALHPDFSRLDRTAAACAAFVTDPAGVAPIWHRLARAAGVDWPDARRTDPAPRLLANGKKLRPIETPGGWQFVLPPGHRRVRLASDVEAPSDRQPWLDDRRPLGLCVRAIAVQTGAGVQDISLDDPALGAGWWALEDGPDGNTRWTAAAADLRLPEDARLLTLRLAGIEPRRRAA